MIIPSGKHSRIGLVDIGYQFVDIGNQVIAVFPNGIDTCLTRRSVIIVYHLMGIGVIIARNAGIVLCQYIEQTESEFLTIQRRRSHRQITTGKGIFKSLLGTKIIFGFYFGFRTHVEPIITSRFLQYIVSSFFLFLKIRIELVFRKKMHGHGDNRDLALSLRNSTKRHRSYWM